MRKTKLLLIALFMMNMLFTYAQWSNTTNFPTTDKRFFSFCFSLNNKIYSGGGYNQQGQLTNDNYEYDPLTNTWVTKAIPTFQSRMGAFSFAIGNYGYVGSGSTNGGANVLTDLWRYDAAADTWTRMADFPGVGRIAAVTLVINNKAYVISGIRSAGNPSDCWEYNPATNSWTQKANPPAGFTTGYVTGFTDGINAYCGLGGFNSSDCSTSPNDFWMYNPVSNTWTQKATLPLPKRTYAVGGWMPNVQKGFVGLGGCNSPLHTDLWTYDIPTDSWQLASVGSSFPVALVYARSLIVRNEAYIGWGAASGGDRRIYKLANTENGSIISLSSQVPAVICSTENDTMIYTLSASGIPANTNIVIYQSTDSLFNPYLGQGDSIGYIPGNAIPQDTVNFGDCIKTLGIFIDACGASGQEGKNEYIILTSGNGIKVSNLAIDFSTQNNGGATNADINTGTSPCLYQTPTPSLITNLRVGSCNASNVIPASPTDSIPANAIILLFTSDNVTANYGIAGLCNLGYPIYVLQSACERTIGAFTNQSRCDAPSRYRTTVAIDKRQNCRDNFTYDLCDIFDEDGTYAIRQQGTDTASVANNGIRINAIDSCGGIDYTQLDFSADTILKFRIPTNFCNDGFHYIKAITNPAGTQPVSNTIAYKLVCNDVSAISTTTTICSGESAIVNISSTDPNATLSWTVSGGTNITGASAGTGNTIQQVLINNGITKDSVTYTAISSDAGCTKTQTVKVVVNNKLNPRIVGNTSLCNGIGGGPLAIDGQFDSVRWSTGATTDTAYVGLAGLYIVTVYQNGCSATASVNVTNTITPTPDVRGNSEICNGNNAVLELFNLNAYDSIRWSNGTNGNQATFTSPGNYTLQAYLNGCITTLQFPIRNCDPQVCNPVITGNIPFCDGDSITLDAGSGFSSYSWNTGASSQTIKVKTGGKYVVSVTGQNDCTGSDSVQVVVNAIPQVSISGNTTFCLQTGTRLTANADVDSLRWNTGETTNSISVDQAQAYSVTVYDNGCSNTASVQVTQLNLPASFSLGNDTSFCGNFSKVLSTGNQQTQWSTSVTAAQITVTEAGTYIATISNDCGSVSDTIVISKNELPFVNLGNDTAFCKGQLVLTAPTELRSYVWSTGEQSQSISVSEAGTYSVTVTDVNGCNGSDEIVISSNCSNELWIANAFTPNSDGVNDVFYIRGNPQNTTIERFIIYNRWGNKVFEATNILPDDATLGWNGTFKGEPAQFEVYGYEVVARFSDGQKKTLKGNVTLLK